MFGLKKTKEGNKRFHFRFNLFLQNETGEEEEEAVKEEEKEREEREEQEEAKEWNSNLKQRHKTT